MRTQVMLAAALALLIAGSAYGAVCTMAGRGQWQPAGMGAGPAGQLDSLTGCDFESAFVKLICQQEADVVSIAALGQGRIGDRNLLAFTHKMQKERLDLRKRLGAVHSDAACCETSLCGSDRVQCISDELSGCSRGCFDKPYVLALIALLCQSREAADLAISRTSTLGIRNLARSISGIDRNEIQALNRWLQTGYLTRDALSRNCGFDGVPGACSYP